MSQKECPRCGKAAQQDARFCAHCGAALEQPQHRAVPEEAQRLLSQADKQRDPKKKLAILQQAQAQFPDCLEVAAAILFLGRLAQRDPRKLDYSVIKSYLWQLYLTPEAFTPGQQDGMRQEFFAHPDLERCLALAPDPEGFMREYLERLAREFVSVFLAGSSQYMPSIFGLRMSGSAAKRLAAPVRGMLHAIRTDAQLTGEQQCLLTGALKAAYAAETGGDARQLETR